MNTFIAFFLTTTPFIVRKVEENTEEFEKDPLVYTLGYFLIANFITILVLLLFRIDIEYLNMLLGTIIGSIFNYLLLKKYLNFKYLLEPVFIITLYFFSNIFVFIPIKALNILESDLTPNIELLISIFSSTLLLVILFFYFKKQLIKAFKEYKNNFSDYFDSGLKYWILGLLIMVVSNLLIIFLIPQANSNNESAVQEMIKLSPWLMLISTAFFAPLIEELVFRLSFNRLIENKYLYAITSGLVFGLMHVVFSYTSILDFLYVIPYGSLGFAFALMLKEKDNVLLPISFHFLHNFILTMAAILPALIGVING